MLKFTLSLSILFAIASLTVGGPVDPVSGSAQWWIDSHNTFKQNTLKNAENINVLFYGDSITQQWNDAGSEIYEKYYAPLGTANYGLSADQTQNLLYRINDGEVEGLSPKLIVLKIGTNNLAYYEDKEIANGIIAVVNLLRQKLPKSKILLLGVLPRENAEVTSRVDNINSIIQTLDDGKSIRFLNMRNSFYKGNGEFYNELFNSDLLHLTTQGFKVWAETMNPIFNEMLNS